MDLTEQQIEQDKLDHAIRDYLGRPNFSLEKGVDIRIKHYKRIAYDALDELDKMNGEK